MKGASNIVSAIDHLRQAFEHFGSFQREHPASKGSKTFKNYNLKLEWIYTDLYSNPFLTDEVRAGIKREWNSDVFSVDAINEKVALLSPEKREMVETVIDGLLKGEVIKFVDHA